MSDSGLKEHLNHLHTVFQQQRVGVNIFVCWMGYRVTHLDDCAASILDQYSTTQPPCKVQYSTVYNYYYTVYKTHIL